MMLGNKYSPTTIVAAITSKIKKAKLPTHIELDAQKKYGLERDSVVLLEQAAHHRQNAVLKGAVGPSR